MANVNSSVEEFRALSKSFVARIPEVQEQIETLQTQICRDGWNPDAALALRQLAHKLAGAGLMMGFVQIGTAARALEMCLVEIAAGRMRVRRDDE